MVRSSGLEYRNISHCSSTCIGKMICWSLKQRDSFCWTSTGGRIGIFYGCLRAMISYHTGSTLSGFYLHPKHNDSRLFFIFSRKMNARLSCDVVSTSPWFLTCVVRITFSGCPPSYRTRSVGFRPYLGRELFRIAPSDTLLLFSRHLVCSVQFSKQKNRELSRVFSPVGYFLHLQFSAMRCWGEAGWNERTCRRTNGCSVIVYIKTLWVRYSYLPNGMLKRRLHIGLKFSNLLVYCTYRKKLRNMSHILIKCKNGL